MTEFLIYSKRCFINRKFIEATLHIKNKKIHSIYEGHHTLKNVAFLDYRNLIVMPGIIDAHVHINEPGRADWEGFETATKAAAMGGITTLIEMPLNASPVTTTVEAFQVKQKQAYNKLHVHCGFYGGVIPSNLNTVESLIKAGVFGIKGFLSASGIDEFPKVEKQHLERIASILKRYNLPLLLHCELEDDYVPEVGNPKSYNAYLQSRPQRWEVNAIKMAIDLQQQFGIKVHIVHLSASDGIPLVKEAKQVSDKLTVETCPHYLFFNSENIPNGAPIYKCAPPIREKQNQELLWNFLEEDGFDFLASDHSPAPSEVKQLETGNFFKAWGGISGLQFTVPVLFSEWKKRGLKLETLIPMLTEKPAMFLGLNSQKGLLIEGLDADITVLDDAKVITVSESIIAHKHKATPYLKQKLQGVVDQVFVNGYHVVQNGEFKDAHKGTILLKNII